MLLFIYAYFTFVLTLDSFLSLLSFLSHIFVVTMGLAYSFLSLQRYPCNFTRHTNSNARLFSTSLKGSVFLSPWHRVDVYQ